MEIRALKSEEWPLLKYLIIDSLNDSPDAFSETLVNALSYPDHTWRELAKKYSRAQEEVAFCLMDNQQPCGILIGSVTDIGHFWVTPTARGNGKRLLNEFLKWARERGSTAVRLYVSESSAAVDIYRSKGFKRTGDAEGSMMEMILKL